MFISYMSTFANMVCGLFLSSFLLRALGDTDYGLYQTVSSFATYLVLLEFGTGTVMTRNISVCLNQGDDKTLQERLHKNYSTIWGISLLLSCVILLVGMVFYFSLGAIYSQTMTAEQVVYAKKILLILFANIIVSYLTQNISGFLLAREEYVFSKLIALIRVILRAAVLVLVITLFRHSILIAIVDLVLGVSVFLITFIYNKRKYKVKISLRHFDKTVFKTSIPMCIALLLQVFTNQANSNVDKFVIGVMMSMESVALYSIVQYIFTAFSSLATVPVSMFLPEVSKNMAKNLPPREFTQTLVRPCRLTVIICGSILCGFFAFGRPFISVVYGASKTDAWLYTLIILVPTFVDMTDAVLIDVLDIANKRLVRSLALLGTTLMNILMTVIFLNLWGIIGAVIATAIALMIGNILIMGVYYQKKFKVNILYLYKEAYAGLLPFQMIAGAVTFAVVYFIKSPLFALLAGAVLYVVLSFGMIWLFGLKPDDKAWLKRRFLRKGK